MYMVELAFDGSTDRLALRPAHREKLAALRDAGLLQAAGPFDDDSGAVLLFRVENESQLASILADDPYYAAPGVTIVRQTAWNPVVTAWK